MQLFVKSLKEAVADPTLVKSIMVTRDAMHCYSCGGMCSIQ